MSCPVQCPRILLQTGSDTELHSAKIEMQPVGDELIMGRWLKGRLAAAGIVNPVNNTLEDTDRLGMITQEMLEEYGCDRLVFKKTGQTALDTDGTPLDVWMLSFTNEKNE